MTALIRRFGLGLSALIIALPVFWIVMMIVLPELVMIDFAFRPNLLPAEIGGPKDVYTLGNFQTLVENTIHRAIFLKTIWASAFVTLVTLVVCYPIAYHLAQGTKPERTGFLILLLIIPFWINEILRTFAWFIILAYNGPLNALLSGLGLIDRPIRFLNGNFGVIIGMVYAYILFMVFPLYNSMESLDRNQIEAARDLGASAWRIHRRIVIPHAKPGIATGCIFTFMLAAGSYAVPALLGSPQSRWFTEIIYNWFFEGGNWNQGAAYAIVLLALCLGFILLMLRVFRVNLGDIAK